MQAGVPHWHHFGCPCLAWVADNLRVARIVLDVSPMIEVEIRPSARKNIERRREILAMTPPFPQNREQIAVF